MRRLVAPLTLLVAAVAVTLGAAHSPAAAAAPSTLSVQLDRSTVAARLGERFLFTSTVRNDGDQAVPGLIAHLNVLSPDRGVYVDPEDWSPRRTQYLGPLPAHGTTTLRWTVQAVNSGPLIIYVAVTRPGGSSVTASGPLDLTVSQRRTINAGGILPLAAGVPALVLVLTGLTMMRRRRLR